MVYSNFGLYTLKTDGGQLRRLDRRTGNAGAGADWIVGAATPFNIASPAVTGQPADSHTLRASRGRWLGADRRISYQWQRCDLAVLGCANIGGATDSLYRLTGADVASRIGVAATASGCDGGRRCAVRGERAGHSGSSRAAASATPAASASAQWRWRRRRPCAPDLELTIGHGPATVAAGESFTYAFVVKNKSSGTGTGIGLTFTLSDRLEYAGLVCRPGQRLSPVVGADVCVLPRLSRRLRDTRTCG